MRSIWVVVVSALVALSCKGRADEPQVRLARLDGALHRIVTPRIPAVRARPEVGQATDAFLAAIASDPELAQAATAFLGKLVAEPGVATFYDRVMAPVAESPEAQAFAADQRRAGLSADAIDAAYQARIADGYQQVLAPHLTAAASDVFDHLDVDAEAEAFWARVEGGLGRSADAYMNAHGRRWSKRLIELNGGRFPDPPRATELYVDRAWSEERLARLIVTICNSPVARREVITALRRLITLLALQAAVLQAVHDLAADTELQRAISAALAALLTSDPDEHAAALAAAVFAAPSVRRGATAIAHVLFTDPVVFDLYEGTLHQIWSDRETRAALDAILDGW